MRRDGRRRGVVALVAALAGTAALFTGASHAQGLSPNPSSFSSRTCQQLWYIEQKTLAEGRVCLKSQRARTAFKRYERCISNEEDILPMKTRDYLAEVRSAARQKGCGGF